MGISPFSSCFTNYKITTNPNPSKFVVQKRIYCTYADVLIVSYTGCTNFEGIKVLVVDKNFVVGNELDPHFSENFKELYARFPPTFSGRRMAIKFAHNLGL